MLEGISEQSRLHLKVIRSIIWHHRGCIEYDTLCRKARQECSTRLLDMPDTSWIAKVIKNDECCPDLELLACGYQLSERDPEHKHYIVIKRYGVKVPVFSNVR